MMRLKALAVAHKWALGLAIVTSLIVAAPQIYFRIDHQQSGIYQGIELMPDSPWSARAREVQDGHPNFGAIYYKEGKDNPYLFQPLGSMVVGYTGKVLGLDINNTFLFARLFYTALVSLLIYAFVYLFSRNRLAALAAPAVLLLAESVLSGWGLMQLLQGRSPDDFLRIARPVNPAMIYLFFFGFLAAFWKFYERLDWRWGALAAVLLGANFYNYFYTWTYLFAFGGVLGLTILLRRKWEEVLPVAAVFLTALALAIPYILNLYNATQHPNYVEVGLRNGVMESHAPLFVGFFVIAALAAYLLFYPREEKRRYYFGLALLLAPFVTMNQQLLTGKVLQASHYHWFFHKPIAVIMGFVLVFYLLKKYAAPKLYQGVFAGLMVAGAVGVGIFVQAASYQSGTNDGGQVAVERQKYGPVMRWLNEHVEPESVIFADNETSHMIAIYTPHNLFYHRAAMFSLASTEKRVREAAFTFYRLRGVPAEDARKVFFAERDSLSANLFGEYYRQTLGSYEAIPDEKLEEVVRLYQDTFALSDSAWQKEIFATYGVQYAVWDKEADPQWRFDRYAFLEPAAEFGAISIYRFNAGE